MARRIFGRARANTTAGTISKPTLTFTDALPRDDLQDLGQISATNVQPAASSGWSRRQEIPANASGFDFRVTEPPEEAVKSDLSTDQTIDDAMIGIALASPGVFASPYSATKWNDEPAISEINKAQDVRNDVSGSLRRRPSKWKKLGGLFKGKQNPPKTSNLPFYQVQINDQPLQSSSEFLSEQGLRPQTRYGLQQDSVRPNKDRDHIDEWPRFEDGKERARDDQGHSRTGLDAGINSSEFKASGSTPLLQVDIPDIHMERYSVMFSSVLGNKQSPGLLARRSKTLDKLKVATDEPNTLEPQRPQRRATSPVPSKSPVFTLFPHAPAAQESKNAGSHTSSNRCLHRSQTAPSMRTMHSKDQALLAVPDASLAPTSSSQDLSECGASPEWSVSDAAILKSKPVKSYVDETKEPVWEMVTAKRTESPETTAVSLRSSKSTPATTPEDIPPMTPPKGYPPEGDQMITPSFHATRERVDRVMTARRNEQPTTTSTTTSPSAKTRHRAPTPGKEEKGSEHESNSPDDNAISPMTPAPLPTPSSASSEKTPKIEISIARSVSVSRGPRQTLVPLGARADQFATADERLVEKQPLVPTVVDVRRGHRPEKSQNVLIETV